ncbi:MAG TPA: hypothetical protein VN809_03380 [Telmatospirillum sp.]|nr:hypothetical protein [Telmatospirillum sp.]
MLSPLQQTPLPLDPVRQQITPTPPVAPPAPPGPAETPVKAADSSQDKFNPKSQDERSSRQEQALTEQQRAEIVSKLRNAFLRLNELQREASAAVTAGDASHAKALAAEAAEVAQTIPASVGILQLVAQESASSRSQSIQTGDNSALSTFDIARVGLGTAKGVVDAAASIPYHPIADRIALDGMRHQVLDAMAEVEAIASTATSSRATVQADSAQHIDVKA